jgi:hypothetical protein
MLKLVTMGLAVAAGLVAAAPASAQYPENRSRAGQVAEEIARTVRETANAVATVRDSVDSSLYPLRYGRAERYAIDACRPAVERYGAMRVDRVDPYERRSWRVYGFASGHGGYGGFRDAYDRSFTCTVRYDGRVKLKTRRLRRY